MLNGQGDSNIPLVSFMPFTGMLRDETFPETITCTHLGIMPLSQFIRTVGEIQLARSGDNTFFKGGPFLVVG